MKQTEVSEFVDSMSYRLSEHERSVLMHDLMSLSLYSIDILKKAFTR